MRGALRRPFLLGCFAVLVVFEWICRNIRTQSRTRDARAHKWHIRKIQNIGEDTLEIAGNLLYGQSVPE